MNPIRQTARGEDIGGEGFEIKIRRINLVTIAFCSADGTTGSGQQDGDPSHSDLQIRRPGGSLCWLRRPRVLIAPRWGLVENAFHNKRGASLDLIIDMRQVGANDAETQ